VIFVLDDDALTLKLVSQALSQVGPVKAVGLWSEISHDLLRGDPANPDLLVCDLQMPGMNGLAFCKIVRKYAPSCRIVLYSGAIDQYPREQLELFADAVVHKRLGPDALVESARRLIEPQTTHPDR
jgi:NarL family two-component system response regulator LiaR